MGGWGITGLCRQEVDPGKGYPKVRDLLAPTAGKPPGALCRTADILEGQ